MIDFIEVFLLYSFKNSSNGLVLGHLIHDNHELGKMQEPHCMRSVVVYSGVNVIRAEVHGSHTKLARCIFPIVLQFRLSFLSPGFLFNK